MLHSNLISQPEDHKINELLHDDYFNNLRKTEYDRLDKDHMFI